MRIAILTANIGAIDEIKGIPRQTIPVDYFCYYDNNLPFPLPNLGDRLRSKYVKIQTHRFLHDYDYFIWIDGRVEISADIFAEEMIRGLGDSDVGIFKHPERQTIGQEYEFILSQLKAGNPYLVSRYGYQAMEKEYEYAKGIRIDNSRLYSCNVFVRKNTPETKQAFNEWWDKCIEFSNFDQCLFSCTVPYLCSVVELDRKEFRNQFTIGRHLK